MIVEEDISLYGGGETTLSMESKSEWESIIFERQEDDILLRSGGICSDP